MLQLPDVGERLVLVLRLTTCEFISFWLRFLYPLIGIEISVSFYEAGKCCVLFEAVTFFRLAVLLSIFSDAPLEDIIHLMKVFPRLFQLFSSLMPILSSAIKFLNHAMAASSSSARSHLIVSALTICSIRQTAGNQSRGSREPTADRKSLN